MKKIISIFCFAIFCSLLTSCFGQNTEQSTKQTSLVKPLGIRTELLSIFYDSGYRWSYMKSPTGRCYEVVTRDKIGQIKAASNKSYGFMGMSEIPCDEVPKGKLSN